MTSTHPDLQEWIVAVTRDLPEEAAETIRSEIEAHYQDSVTDHQQQGKSSAEAHAAAMADLGQARTANQELRATYLSPKLFAWAVLNNIGFLIVIPLIFMIYRPDRPLVSEQFTLILFETALWLPILFAVYAFGIFLIRHMNCRKAQRPLVLTMAGIILSHMARIGSWLFFNHAAVNGATDRLWSDVTTVSERVLDMVAVGGGLATGLGLVGIALAMTQLRRPIYGVKRPLQESILLVGLLSLGFETTIILQLSFWAEMLSLLSFLVNFILIGLLTWIFFRVAYNPGSTPVQTV